MALVPSGYSQPEILALSVFEQARGLQSARLVVGLDHRVEPLASERRRAPGADLERLVEEPAGSVSSARVQPSRRLKARLASTIRRAVAASSSPSMSQPVTRRSSARPLLRTGRRTRRAGTCTGSASPSPRRGPPSRSPPRRAAAPPSRRSSVAGEVGLVGARAVVVGAARVDREAERHRLQRARLVAGQLEALDVRGEVRPSPGRRPRRRAREPSASSVAEPLARADLLDRAQHRRRASPKRSQARR